jgi:undecaprenyl diphosphate synthase
MYRSPVHVACIMDGNGRWARQRGLARTAGHTAGEENLAAVVRAAVRLGIDHLTVFGFSTENWVRPRKEVRHILGLHEKLFGRITELNELNVRVRWIGRPFDDPTARTPRYVQRAITKAMKDTESNSGMTLTVAFDYGGRTEIAHAAERLRRTNREITAEGIESELYEPDLPPVDVVVRTSGETRVSNFLLWQSRGAPISFSSSAWPDFSEDDLRRAMHLARHTD